MRVIIYQMVTALQTDKRQSTEEALAALSARQEKEKSAVIASNEPAPVDLSGIEDMSREQLIALIRLACPQKAQVLMMTEEARGRAIIDMLAITALTSGDRKEARECGKEWMDRTLGKPVQRILEKTQRIEEAVIISQEERVRQADEEADKILRLVYERNQKQLISNNN